MEPLPIDVSGAEVDASGSRCPNCDNRVPVDADECGACGTALEGE